MAHLTRTLAILLFGLALVLGVFAVMLAREPAPAPERDRAPAHAAAMATPQRLVPVVVAARDLPAGKPLDADALTVRMQAESTPGAFGDSAALIGRVPLAALQKGAPLTADALSSGLADVVAAGERAVAVRIDETNAVGNHVRPGDFVDVFFTLKREGGAASGDAEIAASQARLLLSKVRVLSMGDASLGSNENKGKSAAQASPRTAVLAIRTADVDALTLAESAGRLVLALRNAADDEAPAPPAFAPLHASARPGSAADRAVAGISLGALAGARAAPRSVDKTRSARPPAHDEIEVIRGGRAERVAY
ncbi:pilus assembly protein CpaB [Caballeronia novacaledonica]|uniref:Pilus assembly protein CpaB n=1 Tax=Caballeronia novacaledonica TaxID=1544861 RepID=A0A2U3I5T1_9BURK|nr:Flp pilus assembly protein CpaB [Caballeronia novacaledonica]SPB15467.1 pilus assembly protein CpaB [Caballeronia novacaledonica]